MRLTKKEFETKLARVKAMPAGDIRTAELAELKSADVFEADADGKETKIEVEIHEEAAPAPAFDLKAIEASIAATVTKALDERLKASKPRGSGPAIITGKSEYKVPDRAKRAKVKNFKQYEGQELPGERAYKFGMWLMAAAGRQKARNFCEENGIALIEDNDVEQKGHTESVDTTGGLLVPPEFDQDLIDLREQYGVFRQWARNVPMMRDQKTRFRRTGGLTAAFVGETGSTDASTKSWDSVNLVAKKLKAVAIVSDELNEDIAINIGDDLAYEIAYSFAEKEDDCGWNGTGTSTYGGIVGVRTRLTNINGVDDGGGVVLASGNLWSEVVLADFHKCVARIPQYADDQDTAWYVHRTFWAEVMQKLALASGGVQSTEIIGGARVPMFLGYPVRISQKLASAEANSSVCALFGSLRKAVDYGDRRQTTIAMSREATVDGIDLWDTDQIGIKGTERFDINVHDVGSSTAAGPVVGLILAAS